MPFRNVDLVDDAETSSQCVRRLFQMAVFFAELRRVVYQLFLLNLVNGVFAFSMAN